MLTPTSYLHFIYHTPTAGKPTYATNPTSSRARRMFSGSVTMTLLGIVVVVIGSIFWVRVLLVDQSQSRGGKLPDYMPEYLTSAINAVQVRISSFQCDFMLALMLACTPGRGGAPLGDPQARRRHLCLLHIRHASGNLAAARSAATPSIDN